MRYLRASAIVTLGLLAPTLGAQDPVPKPDPELVALVEAHNQERAREGKPHLKAEPRLEAAALVQARDMADRKRMGHDGSDGSTPQERVVKAGYFYRTTGENVAEGYRTVEQVMKGWMDSPPHKKNVLGDFTEIGVAKVVADDGKTYWSAEFGKPMPQLGPDVASTTLIKRINEGRAAAKLGALSKDRRLAKAAQAVALDLAKNKGKMTTPSAFDEIAGKAFRDLAMSTSGGQPDAETLVESLMANPDTKAKLLGKYSRIGIGYANGPHGYPHWSIILGQP